ncbi:peroxiredoxin family protein [Aquimarina rhabdastrellae]
MKNLGVFLLALLMLACKSETNKKELTIKSGTWRAELAVMDEKSLPFIFTVDEQKKIKIYNAEEEIYVDEVTISNDSIRIYMPVFEGYIVAKIQDDMNFSGSFIKKNVGRNVPFKAEYGVDKRFVLNKKAKFNITGNWETVFSKDSEKDRYIAKGIFKQAGDKVTGTFRTTTGDYRYLEGVVDGDELKLSTFDGGHAFLFTAKVSDSIIDGYFYSGNHWKEPFSAKRNDAYELPSANSLTYLKEGFKTLNFSFPDASGKRVSLSDPQFENKVKVIQIMGTWCPNCMDETKYYVDYFSRNKGKPFEFVALAFENAKTSEKAFKAIDRLKKKLKVEYPVLLAQYGSTDKEEAQQKLPMLNHIISYPTSIFIDKKGTVRKIHTGFNGPATGKKYTEFKEEFESFMEELMAE